MFRRRRGFSLMEVLVAVTVLAAGLVSLFNIIPSAWHSFAYSRVLNRIALFSQHKLEDLKTAAPPAGVTSGVQGDLSWTLKAEPVTLEPGVDLVRLQLDVDFSYRGVPQKERFVTYR